MGMATAPLLCHSLSEGLGVEGRMMTGRDEFLSYWPVVAAAFVGIALGISSVPFYILGPLMKPLQGAFGWSTDGLMLCASLISTGVTLSSPYAGRLADRHDPRLLVAGSMIMLAISYLLAAQVSALWQFQALYFFMGFLGAGTSGIVLTRAIGARFHTARGLALGIVLCGSGAANSAAPVFVYKVVSAYDWHMVYLVLAGITLLFALPVTWFGLGSNRKLAGTETVRPPVENYGLTRAEAMRDARFWIVAATVVLFGLPISSLILNMVPMLLHKGMDPARAAATASTMGIMMIFARLVVGTLLDRIRPSLVGVAIFVLGGIGATLLVVGGVEYAAFTVIALGFLLGAEIDLMSFITMRYFGTRAYGEIYGIMFSIYTAVSIIGPLLGAGWIDAFGYEGLYAVAASCYAISAVLFLILSRLSDEKPLVPGAAH